jgi:hypothetical protein
MPYEEEDTCMPYEEEDTCMPYEEEDTCMPYEEEMFASQCEHPSAQVSFTLLHVPLTVNTLTHPRPRARALSLARSLALSLSACECVLGARLRSSRGLSHSATPDTHSHTYQVSFDTY